MPATRSIAWRTLLTLGTGLLAGFWSGPGLTVQKDLAAKGEALVKENCAGCHAIGKAGDSPHQEAPPFRTLSQKYPVTDLAESLAEGIVSGHPDMPVFVFNPQDVEAVIQYLESIQDVPSPPAEEPAQSE